MEARRPPRRRRPARRRTGEPALDPEELERRRQRRGETVRRVLWAAPWIVFAIGIVAAGGLLFTLALIGLGWIGLSEFFTMARRSRPVVPVAFASLAALVVAAHYGSTFQIVLVMVASFPAMFLAAAARQRLRNVTYAMATTMFGVAWIGLPLAHAVLLRDLPMHGGALLIDVLVGTFVGDTCAYAGGRLFGTRRITPRISPNKTLQGLLIGFVGGTAAFWFAGLYQDWLSGADALIMGAAVAALAPVGDLFSSMIKRDLDVKDTGAIFGPHGGLIDRLDAVLFTVVAGYYLSVALVY
jgi:phosphatidate cytidylyltransferase